MVIGVAVVAALYWNRHVTIEEMEVSGIYYTSQEQVIEMAAVPLGIKPDSLDLAQIVQQVEKLNYVKSVVPYVEPSGDLRLTITERQPLALLVDGSHRKYVDAEGVKLNIIDGKTTDLPIVYGFNAQTATDTLHSPAFTQIRDFLVHAKNNKFGWATISEIAYDKVDGVVALSHENGVKLLFGRNNFEIKLENWQAFYTEVIRSKGIKSMRQVDLRFTNQVVSRES
ncbi:MAG: FtsQ-type POTRA domain-containing protein [Balneolaceae bacterium]|nr:FtsQ-type POTRA domain-containing protein [Balneolaceae bacterium]